MRSWPKRWRTKKKASSEYRKLLKQVAGREHHAGGILPAAQISAEEEHLAEIRKMMRKPGSIK